jgi:hypothetical protein
MDLLGIQGDEFTVQFSLDELLVVSNALNEVCNGIDVPEFHARIGDSPDEAQRLLEKLGEIIERAAAQETDRGR